VYLKPGYWAAGYPYDASLLRCGEPSIDRCPGANETMGVSALAAVRCGEGYQDGSILCGACAKGFFAKIDNRATITTVCARCDVKASDRILPVFGFIFSLLCLGLFILAIAYWTSRRFGGTLVGGAKRAAKFILFLFLCVQNVAQVGETARQIPNLNKFLQKMFVGLDKMLFVDVTVPPDCLNLTPFFMERAQMGMVICFLLIFAILMLLWFPITKGWELFCRLRRKPADPAQPPTLLASLRKVPADNDASASAIARKGRLYYLIEMFRLKTLRPDMYRRLLTLLLQVTFAMICRTVLRVIRCSDPVSISIPAYLLMRNDGSSLQRAGISCGPADPLCRKGATSDVIFKHLKVSMAKWYPYQVCHEGDHKEIENLGKATFVLVCILYPFLSFILVSWRMTWMSRSIALAFHGERSSGLCAVRAPCGIFMRAIRRCLSDKPLLDDDERGVIAAPNPMLTKQKKLDTPPQPRSPSLLAAASFRQRMRTSDLADDSAALVTDPYLAPFINADFTPSLFYFAQLSLLTTVALRLTVTFWDEPGDAFRRCFCNMFVIISVGLMIITSRPYKRDESYGQYVQVSVLGVTLLVTIIDLIGNAGSSVDPNDSSRRTASRSTSNAVSFLAFCVFAIMLILGLSLLVLFFRALVRGAREEQEMINKSQRKSVMSRFVAGARSAITSMGHRFAPRSRLSSPGKEAGAGKEATSADESFFVNPMKSSTPTPVRRVIKEAIDTHDNSPGFDLPNVVLDFSVQLDNSDTIKRPGLAGAASPENGATSSTPKRPTSLAASSLLKPGSSERGVGASAQTVRTPSDNFAPQMAPKLKQRVEPKGGVTSSPGSPDASIYGPRVSKILGRGKSRRIVKASS
jgi:hypothetical protein